MLSLLPLLGPLLLACGEGDDTGMVMADGVCANETRATPYETGLSFDTTDGAWTLSFVRADPTPPENGDNRWVVAVTDAGGAPATDVGLSVEPTMPDHGHGTNPAVFDGVYDDSSGGYLFEDISLPMAGYWEFLFSVDDGGKAPAEATLSLCLES